MSLMSRLNDWSGDIEPQVLSLELRKGKDEFLENRRKITALNLVAAGAMGAIVLYQMGIIDHLPEPDVAGFNADKVDASSEAYQKLNMPDAVLGLLSYATTMSLAASGGADRAREAPLVPIAMAAKAVADALQAGKLTWDQWAKHKAFCSYCLLAAGVTFAAVPLALPEARAAWRKMVE